MPKMITLFPSMLHGNGSGYVESEAYGSAEARFKKKIGSGYVLEAYAYIYIYKNFFLQSRTKNYMINKAFIFIIILK